MSLCRRATGLSKNLSGIPPEFSSATYQGIHSFPWSSFRSSFLGWIQGLNSAAVGSNVVPPDALRGVKLPAAGLRLDRLAAGEGVLTAGLFGVAAAATGDLGLTLASALALYFFMIIGTATS